MSEYLSKYLPLIGREFTWTYCEPMAEEITVAYYPAKIVAFEKNYVHFDIFPEGKPVGRLRRYMSEFLHQIDEEMKAAVLQPKPKPTPKNEHLPYIVYTLSDPQDASIHYVGISKHVERRYQEHVSCSGVNLQKNIWVISLLQKNLRPELTTIETVIGSQSAKERETYWIEHHLRNGSPLTNIIGATAYADGGTRIDDIELEVDVLKQIARERMPIQPGHLKEAKRIIREYSKGLNKGWLGIAPSYLCTELECSYDYACAILLELQAQGFIYDNHNGNNHRLEDGRTCATRFFMVGQTYKKMDGER